jgi:hypothetical protein
MRKTFKVFLLCALFHLPPLYVFAKSEPSIPNEFVATYSNGNQWGNLSLNLDSQGHYYIKSHTDTAEYVESGTYTFSSEVLYLRMIKKTMRLYGRKRAANLRPEPDEDSKLSRMIFLQWSGRIYLLDEGEFLQFCNAINLGVEPRKKRFAGEFLLREGDEKKEVSGNPSLAGNWSSYLLNQPVTATVVKIEREGRWNESKIVVIDKGSADGLRVGMILMGKAMTDEEPTFLFDPKVISADEHAARVEMNYNEHIKLGDWVSTKFIPGPYYQWWAT